MDKFMEKFAETKPVVALAIGVPLTATIGVTAYEMNKIHKEKKKKSNETVIAQMSNVTDAALSSHKNDSGTNL